MQPPGAAEFLQFKGLKMPQNLKLMLNFKVKLASNLQLSPQISQGTHAAWPPLARIYSEFTQLQ